jgi:hypothetical protein
VRRLGPCGGVCKEHRGTLLGLVMRVIVRTSDAAAVRN